MVVKKNCLICTKKFSARRKKGRKHSLQRFCSWECYSQWRKGKTFSKKGLFKKGQTSWNKGMKMSPIHRSKLSVSQTGVPKPNATGEKSAHWKGGVTKISLAIRQCLEYKQWREAIFKRDDYTCRHCSVRGGTIHADHIKPFSVIISENKITSLKQGKACQELWEISNGRTLCAGCHKKTPTYGNKSNKLTKQQE